MTPSWLKRDNCRGSDSNGNSSGKGKCHALPSRDLTMTALVLVAETAATLIADDAVVSNGGVAIIGRASLVVEGRVIN